MIWIQGLGDGEELEDSEGNVSMVLVVSYRIGLRTYAVEATLNIYTPSCLRAA